MVAQLSLGGGGASLNKRVAWAATAMAGEGAAYEEGDVVYECVMCGSRVKLSTLEARGGFIRCSNQHCRSRILRKVRPLGVKHVRCD